MIDRFEDPVNDRFHQDSPFFQYHANEVRQVRTENGHHFIRLCEAPGNLSMGAPGNIVIPNLTETSDRPAIGQFRPSYDNTHIYFHQSMSGQHVSVSYYGRGSSVNADHVRQKVDKYSHTLVVFNGTGEEIPRGVAITPTGNVYSNLSVPMIRRRASVSDIIIGLAKNNIPAGEVGEIITFGYLQTNISGVSLGAPIYATTTGTLVAEDTGSAVAVSLGNVSSPLILVNINLLSGGGGDYDWLNDLIAFERFGS